MSSQKCLETKMKTVFFNCTVFTIVLSIVVLYSFLLSYESSYRLPSMGKRSSVADASVDDQRDFKDTHSMYTSLNENDLRDGNDVKDQLKEEVDVGKENSPKDDRLLFDEVEIEEDSKGHLDTLMEEGFTNHHTVDEHQHNTSTTNLQSETKDLNSVELDDQPLTKHKTEIPPSPNLHSFSPSVQQLHQSKTISKSQLSPSAVQTVRSKGYVLAVNYYEQQSMGSRNLFQLQCWAQHLGLEVVKPVMKDSFLLTPLDEHQQQSFLKFEDSFDLKEWTKQTINTHFAPLVEWSEFLSKAPRNVILVQYNYPSVSVLKARQKAGEPVLQDHVGDRYKSGCGSKWPTSAQLAFLISNRFQVVRSVCYNFYDGDQLSVKEFDKHLLGEYSAENVTIIMDLWRGLGTGQRVLIKDTCTGMFPINEYIPLSNRLLSDASRYIQTYLGGRPFIAVMGRLEMTLLTVRKKEPVLPFCLKEIVSELDSFKKDTHINTTFLSIDIGRYGSKKWRTHVDPDIQREFSNLVQNVYSPSTSVSSWEKTFEDVATVRDAGYIGLLQKAIVTQARCVLFVGGGAFQRHALYLYRQLHPRKEDDCLRVVSSCTSQTKFKL